ncbi:hypothetical protein EON79_00845, partial [bacterium]
MNHRLQATDRLPILMYHKVAPIRRDSAVPGHYVPPGLFARQMRLLRILRFESVRMGDLGEGPLP